MLHNHTHPYLQHAQNAEQLDGNIKKTVPLIHFKHVLNADLVPQDYIKTIAHNSNQLAHVQNAVAQKVDTKKTCSQFTQQKCSECGGVPGSHYKNCSQANRPECSECGGTTQSHKKTCSQYVPRKKCPECGSGNLGAHKKTCSHYVMYQSLCDECGAPKSTHKRECSKYKPIFVCKECHKRNGNHATTCSHNNS